MNPVFLGDIRNDSVGPQRLRHELQRDTCVTT